MQGSGETVRRLSLLVMSAAVFAGMALAQEATPPDVVGDISRGAVIAEGCTRCHGSDGHASRANTPHLAGQDAEYLAAQLMQFRSGDRVHGAMNRIAGELSDQQCTDVATYWSAQPAQGVSWTDVDSMFVLLGEDFYFSGGGGVAACSRCHGDVGQGNPDRDTPRVWGLTPDYVVSALERYRLGDVESPTSMHRVAARLTDADIRVLRDFLASQPWGADAAGDQ